MLRPVLSRPAVSGDAEALANALPDSARIETLIVADAGLVQADVRGSDAATIESALTPVFSAVRIVESGAGVSAGMAAVAAPAATPQASVQTPAVAVQSPVIRVEIRP